MFSRYPAAGFSVIEVLVAVFVFGVLSLAVLNLMSTSTPVILDARSRVLATNLANQRIERIRSLQYSSVGYSDATASGTEPVGSLLRQETVTQNNQTFTIDTNVKFVDDPKNGVVSGPLTAANADYKQVQETVSWKSPTGKTLQVQSASYVSHASVAPIVITSPVVTGDDAACDTVAGPAAVNPEQKVDTDFTFKNIGTSVWKAPSYVMSTIDYLNAPLLDNVNPNGSNTFHHTINKAPRPPGTYSFTSQMQSSSGLHFGGQCTRNFTVLEWPSSVCTGVTAPQSVEPGTFFYPDFTFQNTGNIPWDSKTFVMGVAGYPAVPLPSDVPVDGSTTVSLPAQAPFAYGPFILTSQMQTSSDSSTAFGDKCTRTINVSPDDASCTFVTPIETVQPLASYRTKYQYTNQGLNTWKAGLYTLWRGGLSELGLAGDVGPGKVADFIHDDTSPQEAGTYTYISQMKLTKNDPGQFGAQCTRQITVPVVENSACDSVIGPTSPIDPTKPFTVTYNFRNTGNTTWKKDIYQLSDDYGQPTFMPLANDVKPGELATFNYTVNAPVAPGTHSMASIMQPMVRYTPGIGAACYYSITAPVKDDAVCDSSVTPPQTVVAGSSYHSNYRFTNTGNTTWAPGYILYRGNRRGLGIDKNVGNGESYSFVADDQAPPEPGPHNYIISMTSPSGVGFGGTCTQTITVVPAVDNAVCAYATPGSLMGTGWHVVSGNFTLQNNGTTTWKTGSYKVNLGYTWVPLTYDVPPGGSYPVNWSQNAYFTRPYSNSFSAQMLRPDNSVFGGFCTSTWRTL